MTNRKLKLDCCWSWGV